MSLLLKLGVSKRMTGWTVIDNQRGLLGVSVDISGHVSTKPRVVKQVLAPANAKMTTTDLQRLIKQFGDPSFPLICVLARHEYQVFLVDKAVVLPHEMRKSLNWTLGPLLDYPPEQANMAWVDIPTHYIQTPKDAQMYVVAAQRSLIDQRMALLDRVHMRLAAIDIRETGQANIAERLAVSHSGVCLIYADMVGVQITITYQGDLYLKRFIREALFDGLEDPKPNPNLDPESQHDKLDRVALELQRSLGFVSRNFPGLPVDLFYLAPTPYDINLLTELQARLSQPVKALDLHDVFDWPEDSELAKPEVQARYFNALGVALRSSD